MIVTTAINLKVIHGKYQLIYVRQYVYAHAQKNDDDHNYYK